MESRTKGFKGLVNIGSVHVHWLRAVTLLGVVASLWIPVECQIPQFITREVVLDQVESPYFIKHDVIIAKSGRLIINPGVKLLFSPTFGITVFGQLVAKGTKHDRIVMSSSSQPIIQSEKGRLSGSTLDNLYYSSVQFSSVTEENHGVFERSTYDTYEDNLTAGGHPTVRLMEGDTPLEGRLQIYHRGHWRSVCTNSRNWTVIDMQTVCRELGYSGGEFWTWVDHLNSTKQLLWERPSCQGLEERIKDCGNWNAREMGAGVCDHHPNLGLRCDPYHRFPSKVEKNWRGLKFYNAQSRQTYINNSTLEIKESESELKYVDIVHAGVGQDYNVTSAIDVFGVPPIMENILIENSAYNGINITNPGTIGAIRNSNVRNNRAFGIHVNSSWSGFEIDGCQIESNGGDGVHFVFHDAIPEQKLDGIEVFDLCTVPNTGSQIYPMRLSVEQKETVAVDKECSQRFQVRRGYVLTVHFPYLESFPTHDGGQIRIYDGLDTRGNLLTTVNIRNETWPQSVTSTREHIYIEYDAKKSHKILAFMDIVAGKNKDYDLSVSNSLISGNNGRGIVAENIRSQVIIHKSNVTENTHISGVQVLYGSGHVNVSRSRLMSNVGDGLNITYGGGARNVSRSTVSMNTMRGIAIWINESSVKTAFEQETVVEYSEINGNLEQGIFVGNFCQNAVVNISLNLFQNCKLSGVEVWSCWVDDKDGMRYNYKLDLYIGHNTFKENDDFGVKLNPLVNAKAVVEHNYFIGQIKGCLVIKGVDVKELETLPSKVDVMFNTFEKNSGIFVASLGLNHYSDRQRILFTQNFVRYNTIREPYSSHLNPRSRVAAPIVISSSNVDVFRNIIQNPNSKYEIGSHMVDQSYEINCTFNWLGHKSEESIYYRVFDRKDRFNLASIKFIPYLLSPTDPNTEIVKKYEEFVPLFDSPDRMIGGEITGRGELNSGEYTVIRDISIRPGGHLQIAFGVTLKFMPSVGIMVGGKFHAEGYDQEFVKFTLFDPGRTNATDAPVRLIGGRTSKEGRLQVRVKNIWGSVCNYNFDVQDASVACRQLGLVLNPHDWVLETSEIPRATSSERIVMSNVECSEWDSDITKCLAEQMDDIENSCGPNNVVGIRCYDSSWAGIRMAMISEKSVLKYAVVEKAGLLDPHTNEHKPAVQLDFSHHELSHVRISDNTGDGLGIVYSDLYFPDQVNKVRNCEFNRNLGHGLLLRQLGLELIDCTIERNKGAGIMHDPHILRRHQRDIAGWIGVEKRSRMVYLPHDSPDIWLSENELQYIVTMTETGIDTVYNIAARDNTYVISMQLLNPLHNESSEEVVIYDRLDIPVLANPDYYDPELMVWSVRRDQVSFPTVSSSYGITMHYKSGSHPRGNMILMIRAIRSPGIGYRLRSQYFQGPFPKLKIFNSKISNNGRGIAAIYYNRYQNEWGDVYLRKANESIEILGSEITFNKGEAIHVFSPFREIYSSNISEITFMINSTSISENERVIFQYNKDMRSSNNLFHWILRDDTIERNQHGGFQVSLPYVWQYNENHTHSVHFENVTFRNNENFESTIGGHFSHVFITDSNFGDNRCSGGLLSLVGMEKQLTIKRNFFRGNKAAHIVLFDMDSQSDILGRVQAHFERNIVQYNKMSAELQADQKRLSNATYQPRSFAIGLKGHQQINVTNNLFGYNKLDFELLAGIKTAKADNYIKVTHNYWGTPEANQIRQKIFDFDDWNSYAIASYRPFLTRNDFDSPLSLLHGPENDVTLENLSGRLMTTMTLYRRRQPYVIKSDLTVMPDATLSIGPGVVLEFYPSVGILVLGTLYAEGTPEDPIIMRPITLEKKDKLDFGLLKRQDEKHVRLCAEDMCPKGAREGFLEFYNQTTLQWVPMCDPQFTEKNVEVVCKELGFDTMNVHLRFGTRWEFQYNHNPVVRVRTWPEPFECTGKEKKLEDCGFRMSGQLYGHDFPCHWEDDFIFVHCGERNLNSTMEYWGGIRFATEGFEHHLRDHRMHTSKMPTNFIKDDSRMQWVHMFGAGILHNEKSPAILSIMKSPHIRYVNVTRSASHAISVISSTRTMRLTKNYVTHNLGYGFNGVSLTGEAQESDSSSFFPLQKIDIPYDLFGMVDICDTDKVLIVEERVVLYYKYDNFPADCVKIFRSVFDSKNLGFRLLQFNLFNSTGKPWPSDYILLTDGDVYNITTEVLASLTMEDNPNVLNKLYKTTWPSLSVKLHATGAAQFNGFVAEILTLPVSPHGIDRNLQHNVSYTVFENNTLGAIYYGSAGEISPIVTLEKNRIENNCLKFYGNFTSCESAVQFDVQNMRNIYFTNNLVRGNQGGLKIVSDSSGSPTAMKAFVRNNLFEKNMNNEVVYVEGKRSSPYQAFNFYRNVVTRNVADFTDTVIINQVVSNLTENYFHLNYGQQIMEVTGFEKVRLPSFQTCYHNSFYMNVATHFDEREKATIIAGSNGQQYVNNILVNPENSYELAAVNKSRPRAITWSDDIQVSAVDARENWWGYEGEIAVMGRIRDENDNFDLLRVIFSPFQITNKTLLSGKCPPGYTQVVDTCYMYVGGYMNFTEAKEFCRNENASMPYVEGNYWDIVHYLRNTQEDYDFYDRIWVQDVDRFEECTVFVASSVQSSECFYKLPFICETDPKVKINPFAWTTDSVIIGALVALFIAIVLIIFIVAFWCTKSKQRKMERLERKNSIRASIRSSRSMTSMATLSVSGYQRRTDTVSSRGKMTDSVSRSNLNGYKSNGSLASISKSASHFYSTDSGSDDFDVQTEMTGTSLASPSDFGRARGEFSSHPMGRPRPRPEKNIPGLPVLPPQARSNGLRTKGSQQDGFNRHNGVDFGADRNDFSFENGNFRGTPSIGSMSQTEYLDSPQLQSNGHSVKYKPSNISSSNNTNVPSDYNLPRSISMATASTMPLHPSIDHLTEPDFEQMTPVSTHIPISSRYKPSQPFSSKSFDQLDHPFSVQADVLSHRVSLPSDSLDVESADKASHIGSYNIGINVSDSSNSNQSDDPGQYYLPNQEMRSFLPKSSNFSKPTEHSPMLGATERSSEGQLEQVGNRKGRVIETSLDDLEVDYELDETVRPITTYLETNVDEGLPPLRSAKSQYIPPTTSDSSHLTVGSTHSRGQPPDPYAEEFKALSSRSKSMPLETEM